MKRAEARAVANEVLDFLDAEFALDLGDQKKVLTAALRLLKEVEDEEVVEAQLDLFLDAECDGEDTTEDDE